MRLFFEVKYKGTNYCGWQIQNNSPSVQQEINQVLSTLCQQKINITGSGRTDTGVHCKQQFFHADIDTSITLDDLKYKMNNMLPFDISIQSIRKVVPEAHARFDATSRSYEYHIHSTKDPFKLGFSYYFNQSLNIQTMNRAAALLTEGEQDFESFSKVKTEVNNFKCTITEAIWKEKEGNLTFYITANRFLRGMVRAITGTLLDIGLGKISINTFAEIIASKNRSKAGRAVPPEGLYLAQVCYPENIFINEA